jgi:glucose-6-phosphate 1-dehydrogenase
MVLQGAAGDLSTRYLLPALAGLHAAGRLPEGFEVVGMARRDWEDDEFGRFVDEHLREHAADLPETARSEFLGLLRFVGGSADDREALKEALGASGEPVLAYLALPPAVFGAAIEALAAVGLPEGSRVVIEKPFGEDLGSARRLNGLLHQHFPEEAVIRADHFLGEQTVSDILALRSANRLFEAVWSRKDVERVEIVWEETLALEGRASYYDSAGALKDMLQNHLLQVLCAVAAEPPSAAGSAPDDLRDRRVALLRAVRKYTPEEAARHSTRARYTAGETADGRRVPAYAEEEGVEPERETETFAALELAIDNDRWRGVPFVLRTGKALSAFRAEVLMRFAPVTNRPSGPDHATEPNVLRLPFRPPGVELGVNASDPTEPSDFRRMRLGAHHEDWSSPYARLLLGALSGDTAYAVRGDEAEESWRVVEPFMRAWREGLVLLLGYPAGSDGP